MYRIRFIALYLLVFLGVMACSGKGVTSGTFVGEVAGTDAFVAVVTDGETAVAYVCDGQTLSEWLMGDVDESNANLTSSNGAELVLNLTGTGANGIFSMAGDSYNFTAELADAPAGLFRLEETTIDTETYKGGWIILPNGEQRGTLTTSGSSGCAVGNCPKLEAPRNPPTSNPPPPKLVFPNGTEEEVPPVDPDILQQIQDILSQKG